mgnify:CR=1 FL=1
MRNDVLTDAQVDTEIERLNASPLVKLARKERSVRYARRRYLYDLRRLEQRGKQLADAGYTLESLEALLIREDETEEGDSECRSFM